MTTLLTDTIDRLASFEPVPFPVLSLYLNMQPDSVGRDRFSPFLRKALAQPRNTYRSGSPEHESLTRDVDRIEKYLDASVEPASNGLAIFACAGADDFFEAVQLEAPVEQHALYVGDRPHLYPLARLDGRYPRYAAVLADTSLARIFVFGTNQLERQEEVVGQKTKRVKAGGWSQARYQRHVDDYHQHHVKDVVDRLDQIVRDENIERLLLAGDDVIVPLFREHLPPHLAERVVDVLRLDTHTPERQVLDATLGVLREKEPEDEAALVNRLFDEVRAGGLGVAGAQDTLDALVRGQVDLLLISADPRELADAPRIVRNAEDELKDAPEPAAGGEAPPAAEQAANHFVTLARQTSAGVRFIEDPGLLSGVGGVGALLRFRL